MPKAELTRQGGALADPDDLDLSLYDDGEMDELPIVNVAIDDPRQVEDDHPRSAIVVKHYEIERRISGAYMARKDDPNAIALTIERCEQQISIAPQVRRALMDRGGLLPEHGGYARLAAILEQRGDYERAINLCELAMGEGWDGDWWMRINRMEKRMAKARPKIGD